MSKEWEIPNCETIPVIALRGLTVFPNVLIHFDVAREISIKALEAAMKSGQPILLVGQKDISVETPEMADLYTVGTVANVRQILRMPGDNIRVMVEGECRGMLLQLTQETPYLRADVQRMEEHSFRDSAKNEALRRAT